MLDILAGSLNYARRKATVYGLFPDEDAARAYLDYREDSATDLFLDTLYFTMKLDGRPYFKGESSAWTRAENTEIYNYGEERLGRLEDYIWTDDAVRLIRDAYAKLSAEEGN